MSRCVLAALVAAGAYLRLADLGALGIHWDEDLSLLAVRAILEQGVPVLPTGMIYYRGGPFLYLMAAAAHTLGVSELAIRLPAALFGIATIPLVYALGKRLFDVRVGLIAAALVTFSVWDVELARYARMYAAFGFFYLLTVLCIWQFRIRSESLLGGLACVALAVLSITLHELGYTLAPAFLAPLLVKWPEVRRRPRRALFPLGACAAVGAFFVFWRRLVASGYARPFTFDADASPAYVSENGAIVLGVPPGDGFRLGPIRVPLLTPDTSLLTAVVDAAPWLVTVAGAALAALVVLIARRAAPRPSLLERGLLAAAVALAALQLINLALVAIICLALAKRAGLSGFRRADVVAAAAAAGVSFAFWLVCSHVLDPGIAATASVKDTVRHLLDYPSFHIFWAFPDEWPMTSIVAAIGAAWAFDRSARSPDRNRAAAFLLVTLALPIVLNGLFESAFELFRYNVPFAPYYYVLVALGLTRWPQLVPASASRRLGTRRAEVAVTGALAALVLAVDFNPTRAWLVANRDYYNPGIAYRLYDLERYSDFKTPAAYVREHMVAGDALLVFDSREYFSYLGRVDYWIRSARLTQAYYDGNRLRDKYVGTPLIMDAGRLEDVLSTPSGQPRWLIASDAMLERTRAVSAEIKALVAEHADKVVYVGRDRATKVYRFD